MKRPVDYVCIRGEQIPLKELVDPRLYDKSYLTSLRDEMRAAKPFPHLVVDGWFNPKLLELVHQEFDACAQGEMVYVSTLHEKTYRTPLNATLGPATRLYFSLVHSAWFVDLISYICAEPQLIADVGLLGGGLHETRNGGAFDIHCDFDRHPFNGLRNELVVITYLNTGWDPQWQGALEIWDTNRQSCARQVEPEMGRTLVMRNSQQSFHGHPTPLAAPEGRTRRSVACYYYSNPAVVLDRIKRVGTRYLTRDWSDRLRLVARALLPPILWSLIRLSMRR